MKKLQQQFEEAAPQTWQGMLALQQRFSALYSDTSATLNHFVSSTTNLGKQAKTRLSTIYIDTAKSLFEGGKHNIKEMGTFAKEHMPKMPNFQKFTDQATEEFRQQYRFVINSHQVQAASVLITVASITSLAILPVADIVPCIATLGLMIGSAGLAAALGKSFDLGVTQETKEMALKFAHGAAKSVFAMVIQAKLAAVFTALLGTVLVANPLTCAITGAVLASIATAAIVSTVVYGEQFILPRDIRNILFTSPKKECEELLKSKEDYIKEVASDASSHLTEKQQAVLKAEIAELRETINNFQIYENKITVLKEKLAKKDISPEEKKELKQKLAEAMKNLNDAEQKYLLIQQRKFVAKKILPKIISKVISNLARGFFLKLILKTVIKAMLKESMHLTPSNLYSNIKTQFISSIVSCQGILESVLSAIIPGPDGVKEGICDVILKDEQIYDACMDMVAGALDDQIMGPAQDWTENSIAQAEQYVSTHIMQPIKRKVEETAISISTTATELVTNIERFVIGTQEQEMARGGGGNK